jgi:dihydroflavonol-4-reductase
MIPASMDNDASTVAVEPESLDGFRALVLGGTGLIGSHVVAALERRGCAVRVMSRRAGEGDRGRRHGGVGALRDPRAVQDDPSFAALRGQNCEIVAGDIGDPESVRRAIDGCDLLFHAAAPYPTRHFGMGGVVSRAVADMDSLLAICRESVPPELLRLSARRSLRIAVEQADMAARVERVQPERSAEVRESVRDSSLVPLAAEGMLNASFHPSLDACRSLPGLKRIVYTSSITTITQPRGREPGVAPSRPARESDRYEAARDPSPYFRCKRLLEAAVVRAANEGLPAVIVNPTLVIGPGDVHMTTGRLIVAVARGRMPFYLQGKANAIAAEDVGEGHVRAALRGRTGQRYILGNEARSLKDLLAAIATEAGVRPPSIAVPFVVAEPLSLVSEVLAWMVGARWPMLPTHSLRMARSIPMISSSLAVRELGLPQSPVREAIARAIRWYRRERFL